MCSSECSLASVPPASASHDCDGLAFAGRMHCQLRRELRGQSSVTALTAQICHFDGYTYADTALQLTSCVTTTLPQCSDSPIAQTEKFNALECTNSTVGETCVVGCAAGCGLASGDSLRVLTCVSENESVACLTRSLPACQVTRCSTSTNSVPIGVSEDHENITYGASCQVSQRTTSLPVFGDTCTRVVMNPGLSCRELYTPLLEPLCRQWLWYKCVHFTRVFGTRDRCTNARVGSSFGTNEK